jgi:hypothetical protein
MSKTVEYDIWSHLIYRCYNPNAAAYEKYGGRGITVDSRWLGEGGFERFFGDMGPRPSPLLELDRKENDGPYSKDNCRWVTVKVQARNRRSNVNVTWDGRTQCQAAWAEELGITRQSLRSRIKKWGLEKALSTRGRTDGV